MTKMAWGIGWTFIRALTVWKIVHFYVMNPSSEKYENLHFDGLLLQKEYNVWAKKYGGVLWKITEGFKNEKRN